MKHIYELWQDGDRLIVIRCDDEGTKHRLSISARLRYSAEAASVIEAMSKFKGDLHVLQQTTEGQGFNSANMCGDGSGGNSQPVG